MSRKLALAAGAIIAAWLYRYALVYAYGYIPVYILRPALLHGAKDVGGIWLLRALFVVLDVLIIAAVSVPFAILFAKLYRGRWMLVAVAVACVPAIEALVAILDVQSQIPMEHPFWSWTYSILTNFCLLLILPTLTLLATRWPPMRDEPRGPQATS